MSFMNSVDMVEEDAADLQFPKDPTDTEDTPPKQMIYIKPDYKTKYETVSYNVKEFDELVEKALKKHHDDEDDFDFKEVCVTCNERIEEPYIKCVECSALLCPACFAKGRETESHQSDHSYMVMHDDMEVFSVGSPVLWTAKDEKILIRGLRKHGYGNWEDIVKEFNGKYREDECRDHYHDCYFGGIFEKRLGLAHADDTYFPSVTPYIFKMRSIDPPRNDDITSVQYEMMAGYRCARGEFDIPYDNSAESILTSLLESEKIDKEIEPDEKFEAQWKPVEEELKCALVRSYNHRLKERYRRYKVMRDHGLIMINKTMQWFSQYVDAVGHGASSSRFLVFMQISNPDKFNILMESLKYYKDVEQNIYNMYELREKGVKSLEAGQIYFKLKTLREEKKKEQVKEGEKLWYKWRDYARASEQLKNPFYPNLNVSQRKKPGPLDILGLPGYSSLTNSEKDLCSNVRLVPQNYLDYKKILIAENAKVGHVRLNDARRLIKIDVNKTRQIYDFLIENGHINKPPS